MKKFVKNLLFPLLGLIILIHANETGNLNELNFSVACWCMGYILRD